LMIIKENKHRMLVSGNGAVPRFTPHCRLPSTSCHIFLLT